MKQKWFSFFVIVFSIPVFASHSIDCDEIRTEQIRLVILGSNLININTTRTPEGEPYHPFKINSCFNGGCETTRVTRSILKYLSGHPDADKNGDVAYPDFDQNSEYTAFNLTVAKLRLLGEKKVCGMKVIDNGSSLLLKYEPMSSGVTKTSLILIKISKSFLGCVSIKMAAPQRRIFELIRLWSASSRVIIYQIT